MTAKALQTAPDTFSLTPSSLEEAMKFATLIAESDLAPKDYRAKPGNVLIAMQMGMELGLPPMQSIQNIAVINGRPAVWGDAIPALCKAHPLYERLDETFDEETMTATCRIKRKGEPEQVRTFSEKDAAKAGLWGKQGPWQQYPKRMLQMRARAFACRDVFPDALKGIAVAEEARDIEKAMGDAVVVGDDQPTMSTDDLNRRLTQQREQTPAPTAAAESKPAEGDSAPTLNEIIVEIRNAHDMPALEAAGKLARKLGNDQDKKEARKEFTKRKKELEKQSAAVAGGPPLSRSEIRKMIADKKKSEDMAEVLDVINSLPAGTDTEKQMKKDMKAAWLERRQDLQNAENQE